MPKKKEEEVEEVVVKVKGSDLEAVLKSAGVDIAGAKAGLKSLQGAFGKGQEVPDGALNRWVDGVRGHSASFWRALGRHWLS